MIGRFLIKGEIDTIPGRGLADYISRDQFFKDTFDIIGNRRGKNQVLDSVAFLDKIDHQTETEQNDFD